MKKAMLMTFAACAREGFGHLRLRLQEVEFDAGVDYIGSPAFNKRAAGYV
jgi:hypothetical protein